MGRTSIHDRLAQREAAIADANALHNRNMYKAMAVSRSNNGPYTYDELFEDFDYGEACLCSPVRFIAVLLLIATILFASLYAAGTVSASGSSSSEDGQSMFAPPSMPFYNGMPSPPPPFNDVFPQPLPVQNAIIEMCDPSRCQVSLATRFMALLT